MTVSFVVPGEPKGKGRPRFMRNGHTYTPSETASYENLVKLAYRQACGDKRFDESAPLFMEVSACFSIPSSASKTKRKDMKEGRIFPTKKPDADNIIKIVADSLNKIAYKDDSQIVFVRFQKQYSETPCVKILISNDIY